MITKRVNKIKPSPTLAITAKANSLRAQGVDVIGFGAGEPDFDTPAHIKEAAVKSLNAGFTKYTAVGGTDALKDAIIAKLKRDNGLDYTRSQILVSCGAKHSLYNLAVALLEEGDEVIIPAPYWVTYPDQVLLCDALPVIVKTTEETAFKITPDQLRAAATPKTKALVLNTPSNPTGAAYTRRELEAIADVALKHCPFIISDEIYEKLVYDGFEHVSIASLSREVKDRTIVINGFSKSHAMTGWRLGYAAGPEGIISAMNKVQSQSTSNPTSFAQQAAVAAYNGSQECVDQMVRQFDRRRRYIVERLNSLEGARCFNPQGAFYVFPNVSGLYGRKYKGRPIAGSVDLASFLLDEAKVAVVDGVGFGADDYIRISYATSMENIEKGMDRIEKSLSMLT